MNILVNFVKLLIFVMIIIYQIVAAAFLYVSMGQHIFALIAVIIPTCICIVASIEYLDDLEMRFDEWHKNGRR